MSNSYSAVVSCYENVMKYTPAAMGWIGTIAFIGFVFGAVDQYVIALVAAFSSGLLGVMGHHALEMGWYDAE